MATNTSVTSSTVLRTDQGSIATLTLNRPEAFNALSMEVLEAMLMQLEAIEQDQKIQVVIIGAAGKAFCPGHDLKEMRANRNKEYGDALFNKCTEVMLKIRALPQPVIAKVQGVATAAGCQLVATCDLAVAAEKARFAVSGINMGLFCSTPAVALSRNLTPKKAMELLLTGEFMSAQDAMTYGLVNRVVPSEELDAATQNLADTIASKAPFAVRIGKDMFYKQLGKDLTEAYEYASERIVCNMLEDEMAEGFNAFVEKRKPEWKR